jgi:gamma-glutamyltranspeptidase/glutathione hydrolase
MLLSGLELHAIPVSGHKIMIAAASPYAVEAGKAIEEAGGNAVDVAVTVSLTMSVTSPYFASLGGGGFAVVKMGGAVEALDFREVAPAATKPDYYANLAKDASITGGHAVGVPGIPAGLYALHRKYGKLKWSKLFETPLRLASRGFRVSGEWVSDTKEAGRRFNKSGARYFAKADGSALKPGEILKQPQLARALILLRDKGEKGFYQGPIAQDISKTVQASGGSMTTKDLADYKVRWREPMTAEYNGYKIYMMPPPSSGGVVIKTALKLIEDLKVKDTRALSVEEMHMLTEIESRAFRGRVLLGDPDFHKNPIPFLTSDKYLKELRDSIHRKKATTMKPLLEKDLKESAQTTHFSVMDSEGHGVALTETLNGTYGSAVVSDTYGIALNNEMDDFTTHPGNANMYGLLQGEGNSVQPGKRPLSSMTPTLVEKDGKVVMAIGAPGGPRIISAVLQGLYRILGRDTDIDWAIQAPRVHHQFFPNKVFVDKLRLAPEVIDGLKDRGHIVEESRGMGRLYVVRLRADGILEGAFDSRGEGSAGGI